MSKIDTVVLSKNHFLSIFTGNDIVQPYRFQPSIRFVLPFEEYVSFCKDMVVTPYSWLSWKNESYLNALKVMQLDSSKILKLYYWDMSVAILSEIILAIKYKKNGTLLFHSFKEIDTQEISFQDIQKMYKLLPVDVQNKAEHYTNKGELSNISRMNITTQHNMSLYWYALYLRALAFQTTQSQFRVKMEED